MMEDNLRNKAQRNKAHSALWVQRACDAMLLALVACNRYQSSQVGCEHSLCELLNTWRLQSTVEARKLEDDSLPTPKLREEGKQA